MHILYKKQTVPIFSREQQIIIFFLKKKKKKKKKNQHLVKNINNLIS